MFWKQYRTIVMRFTWGANPIKSQKMTPGLSKMKIFENFENHQKWFKTSPEHENMIKYMILDEIQWTKPSKNRKIENWCSKCAISQKPVPEAIRIEIPSGIDLIWLLF